MSLLFFALDSFVCGVGAVHVESFACDNLLVYINHLFFARYFGSSVCFELVHESIVCFGLFTNGFRVGRIPLRITMGTSMIGSGDGGRVGGES